MERLSRQSIRLVGSQGYTDRMPQREETGVLLLSVIWGSGVGKGLQRLLSDWIIRKRQPRTACEPTSSPRAFVLFITVNQDRKSIFRGVSRMRPNDACLRLSTENNIASFLQQNAKLATPDPQSCGWDFPDILDWNPLFETHALFPLVWQLTYCTACTSSAPCGL